MRKFLERMDASFRSWFFAPASEATAAALRVGFGGVWLYELWDLYPVRHIVLGHSGIYPTLREGYLKTSSLIDLLYLYDAPVHIDSWFWISVVAGVMVILGIFTRVSSAALLFLFLLLMNRNRLTVFGADYMLMCYGVWMCFLRGGRFSVDSLLERKIPFLGTGFVSGWPIKVIQIQLALIYFITACFKVSSESWREGSAMHYLFQVKDSLIYERADFLATLPVLLVAMTYATLVFQFLFPIFVWVPRFRGWCIGIGLIFHAQVEFSMSVQYFTMVAVWAYLSFLRQREWDLTGSMLTKVVKSIKKPTLAFVRQGNRLSL